MDKSKLKIASVELIDGGIKGMKVEYLLPSVKGNVQFLDTYKVRRKAPIHEELEKCFSWLPNFLLDICAYTLDKEEREYLINCTHVTKVKFGEKGIELSGSLAVLSGNKEITLTTPLIVNETDYPDFGKLASIINGIYTETADYMAGKKVMSDIQLVIRTNAKNQEFDRSSFDKMSKDEQKEMAMKILEDMGCMVFDNDEFSTEKETETIFTETKSFEAPQKTPIKEKKKEEPVILTVTENNTETKINMSLPIKEDDEDDFSLQLLKQPVKESTAKRKTKAA